MEQMNFDEAMSKLEGILDNLEANGEQMNPEEVEAKIAEAEQLRDYCKALLKKEREDLIKTAKENNIPLEELGLSEDEEEETEE
ncbi:MAG: hypothetical protein J6C50_00975 [Rickettsiales bacterium]|nr:hypothetical protein [Rickettsiales bacterium]